jgi:hypothetical protein
MIPRADIVIGMSGYPAMIPSFCLGVHLCKFGLSVIALREVLGSWLARWLMYDSLAENVG